MPALTFLIISWSNPEATGQEVMEESEMWILKRRVIGWSYAAMIVVIVSFTLTVFGDFFRAKETKAQYQPVQEQLYRRVP